MKNNGNEWEYNLKQTHLRKLEAIELKLKNSEKKNTHLAEEVNDLNKKLQIERELKNEIMQGFIKLRARVKELEDQNPIEKEYFTNTFTTN